MSATARVVLGHSHAPRTALCSGPRNLLLLDGYTTQHIEDQGFTHNLCTMARPASYYACSHATALRIPEADSQTVTSHTPQIRDSFTARVICRPPCAKI